MKPTREHRIGDEQKRRGDFRIDHGRGERHENQRRAEARKAARRRGDEGESPAGRRGAVSREAGREEVGHGGWRTLLPSWPRLVALKTGVNTLMGERAAAERWGEVLPRRDERPLPARFARRPSPASGRGESAAPNVAPPPPLC